MTKDKKKGMKIRFEPLAFIITIVMHIIYFNL